MGMDRPRTVGELRSNGYRIESVKDELSAISSGNYGPVKLCFQTSSATERP